MYVQLRSVYYALLFLSAILSLVQLKRGLPYHLKVFAILLGYTAMVEMSSFALRQYLPGRNNLQLYNFFMLAEFLAYAWFFRQIIASVKVRKLIDAFLFTYPVFWFYVVFFIFKIDEWNSYVFVGGALFTVFWAVMFCFQTFVNVEVIQYGRHSEFWISIGLILFYTCGVPYMGMFNFLTKNAPQVALFFKNLLLIMNIVMYSLFSYAYLCRMISTKKYLL